MSDNFDCELMRHSSGKSALNGARLSASLRGDGDKMPRRVGKARLLET